MNPQSYLTGPHPVQDILYLLLSGVPTWTTNINDEKTQVMFMYLFNKCILAPVLEWTPGILE